MSHDMLEGILGTHFGPYLDSDILSDECKSVKNRMLTLHEVELECAGEAIGLDESECLPKNPNRAHPPRTCQHPIRFRGIMTIDSVEWLSEKGYKYIQEELRTREYEWRTREGQRRSNNISLEQVINTLSVRRGTRTSKKNVKVLIQGFKSMPAIYLSSDLVPHGLLWSTRDNGRQYSVISLHVDTFSRSQNYLVGYRMIRVMEQMALADHKTHADRRTPDYFVKQYLKRYAYPDHARRQRLICAPSDLAIRTAPRQPRTIHRSEVYGMFASQAKWIYNEELGMTQKKQVIDLKSWKEFKKKIKRQRADASREGVRWGWPFGPDHEDDDDEEEESDSDDVRIIGRDAGAMRRRERNAEKARLKGKQAMRPPSRSPTPPSEEDQTDPLQMHHYDSDFSVESYAPGTFSPDEDSDDLETDEIRRMIPSVLFRRPDPPGNDFCWWCPVKNCTYLVDMRKLTEENVRGLDGKYIKYLQQRKWRNFFEDKHVVEGFLCMVNAHYENHLTEIGLRWERREYGNAKLVWINPKRRTSDVSRR